MDENRQTGERKISLAYLQFARHEAAQKRVENGARRTVEVGAERPHDREPKGALDLQWIVGVGRGVGVCVMEGATNEQS